MRKLLVFILVCVGVISCIKEPYFSESSEYQTISFSNKNFDSINITTRGTLTPEAENRILNLYAILFDSSGDKIIYKHHFTSSERKTNAGAMPENEHSWTIIEEKDGDVLNTSGKIRIKSADVSGGTLYIITNVDDELFNLSVDVLSTIKTESELLSLTTRLNTLTTSRMGSFLMVGKATGVTISDGVLTSLEPISLKRLCSKVEFNVSILPGATTTRDGVKQEIKDFEPISWQVLRVPKSCNLFLKESDNEAGNPDNFFDTEVFGFESQKVVEGCTINNFSFYTLENRQSGNMKNSVSGNYHLRDKRLKTATGRYSSGDMWEYAPEYSTYVKFDGNVVLSYDEESSSAQTLNSLATYYVHLGDFADDKDNYDILRNTRYIYNIKIAGVDKIQVEVEKDNDGTPWSSENEEQSGATGEVFVSQEDIHIFDAHYSQKVFRFNVRGMLGQSGDDPKKLTWFVNTPFGHKGMPDKVGTDAIDVVTGLDYKWVHFLLNSKEASYIEPHGNVDGTSKTITNTYSPNYCQLNRAWPGKDSEELMDVVEFCDFLRKQINAYKNEEENVFDSEGNIYVTVFIDEFYYDVDPTSGESRTALWHEFVNQPMRTMHIMCNSSVSADGESSMIKSAVSIRQLAIQTIYNTEAATEGWGSETEDEFDGDAFFFNRDTERRTTNNWDSAKNHKFEGTPKNTSINNGLFNSGHMWGLLDDNNQFVEGKTWSEHIDFSRQNRENFLKDDPVSQTLRYACLTRNRDENGNGIIDQDEIKWYAASIGQLQQLYLGEMGLTGAARLYNLPDPGASNLIATDKNGQTYYTWRNHVVSSTASNANGGSAGGGYRPLFIWSEEGPSVSQYGFDNPWNKPALYSIRCIRNLFANKDDSHNMEEESDFPESVVEASNNNGTWTFDMSRLNDLSKRAKVTGELLPLDEKSVMSLLSERFEAGDKVKEGTDDKKFSIDDYFSTIKPNLEKGLSFCPDGYRMPNIREMSVIFMYAPSLLDGPYYMVCNYYSFGNLGNGYDYKVNVPFYTWGVKNDNVTIEPNQSTSTKNLQIRCVRDL